MHSQHAVRTMNAMRTVRFSKGLDMRVPDLWMNTLIGILQTMRLEDIENTPPLLIALAVSDNWPDV
jgi:hypothetical protein